MGGHAWGGDPLPAVCAAAAAGDALGQRQRAAEQHDVSVAGESAEVAEEPGTQTQRHTPAGWRTLSHRNAPT